MSDYASEWSGRVFGVMTGFVVAAALWLVSLSLRFCGSENFGPKPDFMFSYPFAPMETYGGPFGVNQYCTSALGSDLLLLLPWILALVGGAIGYFIGNRVDRRSAPGTAPKSS